MLQQIIRSISRAILHRVADSNEKLKNSINENASKSAEFEKKQLQTNKQLLADLNGKEERIGKNRLDTNNLQDDTNKLKDQATAFEKNVENLVRDLESHKTEIWADVKIKDNRITDNTNGLRALHQEIKTIDMNVVALTEEHLKQKAQIWADLEDKDRRIVDNTLGVESLQSKSEQLSSELFNTDERVSDLRSNFETKHGELSDAHYGFEAAVKKQYAALTGLIDDTNLDSIREIAARIKDDATQVQTIRQEMQLEDSRLNSKIDALLPKELHNKTAAEWEQIIEAIVEEEVNSLNLEP